MMDDLKKAVNAPERLIDANELMEWLRTKIRECVFMNTHAEAATTEEIIRYVKHMPAMDAAPVVHGRWEEHEDCNGNSYYTCSACGCDWTTIDGTPAQNNMRYCPECGAKNLEG